MQVYYQIKVPDNSYYFIFTYVQVRKRSGPPLKEQWSKKIKLERKEERGHYQQAPKKDFNLQKYASLLSCFIY